MGRAGWTGRREVTVFSAVGVAAASVMDPHWPQSGQQPSHLAGRCPHTSHSYDVLDALPGSVLADGVRGTRSCMLTPGRLVGWSDNPAPNRRDGRRYSCPPGTWLTGTVSVTRGCAFSGTPTGTAISPDLPSEKVNVRGTDWPGMRAALSPLSCRYAP
jgi:hypothetical protein